MCFLELHIDQLRFKGFLNVSAFPFIERSSHVSKCMKSMLVYKEPDWNSECVWRCLGCQSYCTNWYYLKCLTFSQRYIFFLTFCGVEIPQFTFSLAAFLCFLRERVREGDRDLAKDLRHPEDRHAVNAASSWFRQMFATGCIQRDFPWEVERERIWNPTFI